MLFASILVGALSVATWLGLWAAGTDLAFMPNRGLILLFVGPPVAALLLARWVLTRRLAVGAVADALRSLDREADGEGSMSLDARFAVATGSWRMPLSKIESSQAAPGGFVLESTLGDHYRVQALKAPRPLLDTLVVARS